MKLVTREIERGAHGLREQDGKGLDAEVHAKFFTTVGGWTWYMTEYDPEDRLAFGLVIGFEPEWGYFSIDELEANPVERDLYTRLGTVRDLLEREAPDTLARID